MDARTGKKFRLGRLFDQQSGKGIIIVIRMACLLVPIPVMETVDEMRRRYGSASPCQGIMMRRSRPAA